MNCKYLITEKNQPAFSLCLIILLLFISTTIHAAPPVMLKSGVGKYDLSLNTDILEDKTGKLTIKEVISPVNADRWVQNKKEQINFAFSHSVYWLRITLTSDMNLPKDMLFELAFALHDYVDYYELHDGDILKVFHTGDRRSFNSRPVDYRNFLFEFNIAPKETKQIFLRLQAYDGIHEPCPILLWDQQSFSIANGLRNLGIGLYFGVMVAMVIYNLFIFFSIRDRSYAFYVAYITFFLLWLITYYGFSFQYLWPNSPNWANQFIILSSSSWGIFMILFVRFFLDTKRLAPWFDRIANVGLGFLVFNIVFSFTGHYVFGIKIILSLGILVNMAIFTTGIVCFKAGYRPARYFLLAWTTLLLSLVVFILKISGVLPAVFIVEKSIQIGSAIEVILLSLALADRINSLKKEKYLAQEEAMAAFESSLKLKKDFITSISHELRTPMNAIMGGLEVVQKHTLEHLKTPLDIIRAGASGMMNLVNDILTYTEIQSDRLIIQSDPVPIHTELDSLRESYHPLCYSKGLKLVWQVDPMLPKWILTDKEKLVTILSKLLDNAIKFTEKGTVTLLIQCDPTTSHFQFICTVKDTGIGIAPENQRHMFDSFIQSEGGFQRRYGGLGIGLSICKKLTELLGGEIKLESIEGQGSLFTVNFPIVPGAEPVTPENQHRASAELPVLIVEDNIVNQKVMIKLLEKIGYSSLIANNGKEAIDLLEKEEVSVILMDLQMPVMDGFTCTANIRARVDQLKHIPIIAVTANLMDADKKRCMECGMNDFIKKPINLDVLRGRLACYIESRGNGNGSEFFVMVDGNIIADRRKIC